MKNKGFTLIELMIVVAIIAIIAAIAIPNLLRSRMSANEASAVGAIRTISSSQASYQTSGITTTSNGMGQYASLAELGATSPPFIDTALAGGTKAGYTFSANPTVSAAAPGFTATADPVDSTTGTKYYFVDESGQIRFATDGPATSASTSIN